VDPYVTEYGFSLSVPSREIRDGIIRWLPHISPSATDNSFGPVCQVNGVPALASLEKAEISRLVSDIVAIRRSEEAFARWLDAVAIVHSAVGKAISSGSGKPLRDCVGLLDERIARLREKVKTSAILRGYFGSLASLFVDGVVASVTGGFTLLGLGGALAKSAVKSQFLHGRSPIGCARLARSEIVVMESLRLIVSDESKVRP
jgi:hypothetical protein